jgi:hypothetical protein
MLVLLGVTIMNIFALSKDHLECAMWHNNKHCSKMILEHTQMLCTTLNFLGVDSPYRSVHKNHPCRIWTGTNRANFVWLCELTFYLGEEFTFRYGKKHKSVEVANFCFKHKDVLPEGELTKFALAMPDEYKVSCSIESYRNYYKGAKKHLANWGPREKPYWY